MRMNMIIMRLMTMIIIRMMIRMMMMMITDASRSQSAGVAPGDHLRVIYPG